MQKKDLQLTLNIRENLSEKFPRNEFYDHVSLTLTGVLYDNDIRFLSGYDDYYESDGKITGGITYFQVGVRWNTIDLDLSGINLESCYISKLNEIKVSNKKGRKKKYVVNGKIIGTYEEKTIPINISLYDDELDYIKDIIKSGHYKDLREAIKNDFPEICEKINSKLIPAAYKFYRKEYKDYFSEGPNDGPGDIWLTGYEYSCPIPEEWK